MQLKNTQTGLSLVELMVALAIGSMFTLAAVNVMSNALVNSTLIHQMAQLTQEMRSTMQLVSRDVRRSGRTLDPLAAFRATVDINSGLTIGSSSCLRIQYQADDATDRNAVYRLIDDGGIGKVAANFGATADCTTNDGWVDITDPNLSDITNLQFTRTSQTLDIGNNAATGNPMQFAIERVSISITGVLVRDASISRTIENEIYLRNGALDVNVGA
jgi:prepilin-type N-terminal cleavage/methylation domain-containing protein